MNNRFDDRDREERRFRNEVRGFMNRYDVDRAQEARDRDRQQFTDAFETNPEVAGVLVIVLVPVAIVLVIILRLLA